MHRLNRRAFLNVSQVSIDIFSLILSYLFSFVIMTIAGKSTDIIYELWVLFSFSAIYYSVAYGRGLYKKTYFTYLDRTIKDVLYAGLMATIYSLIIYLFIKKTLYSNLFFGIYVLISISILVFERISSVLYYKQSRRSKTDKAIIIGSKDRVIEYLYYIKKTTIKFNIIGYVLIDENNGTLKESRSLGSIDNFESILNENIIDEVVFTLPKNYPDIINQYISICEKRGLTIKITYTPYEIGLSKSCLHSVGPMPVITYHTVCLDDSQMLIKRIIDILGSLTGIIIMSIFSIIIVPAIKLDSRGSVLFSQNRVGQNGRVFKLYKFRSMVSNAEIIKSNLEHHNQVNGGYMFKIQDDPRVTKVGAFLRRTSLDELPQFINVIKGDMSLVGTRPPTIDEVKKYSNHQYRRISIKPGITGLWQISGRSDIKDFEEVVRLDTQYIDDWSVWGDIKIILKTVFIIFKKSGAY